MEQIKKYTITVFADNKPGVLYRIADLFLRRKVNLESLTVSDVEIHDYARFTIVVKADLEIVEKIVKQLYRIIEVTKVFENVDEDLLYKEVAFMKVSTKNAEKRSEVKDIVHMAKASII